MVHTATQDDQTVPPVEGRRREEGKKKGGRGGDIIEGSEIHRTTHPRVSTSCVYLLLVLQYKTVVVMAVLELREVAVSDLHRTQHCN